MFTHQLRLLDWHERESPIVFTISRQAVLWQWTVSPAIVACYALLLKVYADFYEITGGDVVDMMLAAQDVLGCSLVVVRYLFRGQVRPLTDQAGRFLGIEVFD